MSFEQALIEVSDWLSPYGINPLLSGKIEFEDDNIQRPIFATGLADWTEHQIRRQKIPPYIEAHSIFQNYDSRTTWEVLTETHKSELELLSTEQCALKGVDNSAEQVLYVNSSFLNSSQEKLSQLYLESFILTTFAELYLSQRRMTTTYPIASLGLPLILVELYSKERILELDHEPTYSQDEYFENTISLAQVVYNLLIEDWPDNNTKSDLIKMMSSMPPVISSQLQDIENTALYEYYMIRVLAQLDNEGLAVYQSNMSGYLARNLNGTYNTEFQFGVPLSDSKITSDCIAAMNAW